MFLTYCLYYLTLIRSRSFILKMYDHDFWISFKKESKTQFRLILPNIVSIGPSMFAFSYHFALCYLAWYKAFHTLGLRGLEIDNLIWKMNEKMITVFPKSLIHLMGKFYFYDMMKKAPKHVKRQEHHEFHPLDWKVSYRIIDSKTFELDITECAFKKMATSYNTPHLLPGICRMDYLYANLMGNGFVRTKTLADGDNCCNCRYTLRGETKWNPEEGFHDRK